MKSQEYETKCKKALVKILKEKYESNLKTDDLHLVWFAKTLQNFKCVLIDLLDNQRYYECTYNGDKDELYVDIYEKQYNVCLKTEELAELGTK